MPANGRLGHNDVPGLSAADSRPWQWMSMGTMPNNVGMPLWQVLVTNPQTSLCMGITQHLLVQKWQQSSIRTNTVEQVHVWVLAWGVQTMFSGARPDSEKCFKSSLPNTIRGLATLNYGWSASYKQWWQLSSGYNTPNTYISIWKWTRANKISTILWQCERFSSPLV